MITLKDFVKETLTEINQAIIEFSDENKETGANPNPPLHSADGTSSGGFIHSGDYDDVRRRYDTVMPVEFDVAVTAEDTKSTTAGGSIRVVSFFKADGSVDNETTASSVSRVSFRVPLRLPKTGQ